jgi:cysteinyl-tRNA synthetase
MTKERPCSNCGHAPLQHSAKYMLCFDRIAKRWLTTQYAPDPNAPGIVPASKPASMAHLCAFPAGVDVATVAALQAQMVTAREARDYKLADSIRATLQAAGVRVSNERVKPA